MYDFICKLSRIYFGKGFLDSGFSLEANSGIYRITGENGSGKTTLLNAIGGVYRYEGICTFKGSDLRRDPCMYKLQMGFCPDTYMFVESITALEYAAFIGESYGIGDTEGFIEDLFVGSGLYMHRHKAIRDLSLGNVKKLLIIASLIGNPYLWILDEPMNALDRQGKLWLMPMIEQKRRSGIIILTDHSGTLPPDLCEDVACTGGSALP